MKKTIAIIQARTGSTRLPGKIFMDLAGKPLIWHVIDRLKRVKNLDGIAIATSAKRQDDKVEEYAKTQNIPCFRGSEEDVLDRYIGAAEMLGADNVVRITCDAALIDPEEIEKMIELQSKEDSDYVGYDYNTKHVYEGFEVIKLSTLKKIRDFTNEKYYREHVTIYVRENPEFAKVAFLPVDEKFLKSNYNKSFKLSVDTPEDLQFMAKIYKALYKDGEIVDLGKALDLIKENRI